MNTNAVLYLQGVSNSCFMGIHVIIQLFFSLPSKMSGSGPKLPPPTRPVPRPGPGGTGRTGRLKSDKLSIAARKR